MSSEMNVTPGTSLPSPIKRRVYIEFNKDISPKKMYSEKTKERLNASFSGNREKSDDLRSTILSIKSKSTPRIRKPRLEVKTLVDPNKKRLPYDVPMVPKYKDYQLLGDSQLVRFSEQMLGEQAALTEDTHSRYIGFCVSGQRINDLRSQLAEYNYKVHSNVIMMIGTNDIIQNTDLQWMCSKYSDLLSNLLAKCDRIVLLTIPPIPKIQTSPNHWFLLERFNNFIKAQEDRKKVFIVDIGNLYISYNNTASLDYYEKKFHHGDRPDLVHLNLSGFKLLQSYLDTFYFKEHHIQ